MAASKFPIVDIKGNAAQRGEQQGRLFGDRIRKCAEFYYGRFALMATGARTPFDIGQRLQAWCAEYREVIQQYSEWSAIEIEALARAAKLEAWQAFMLNARTEIFHRLRPHFAPNECTSLYFGRGRIAAQTWDWAPQLEELALVLRITYDDGRHMLTMTEPGILAKIGFNAHGVAVCLNIMRGVIERAGVPVHVLLRSALECASFVEAKERIYAAPRETMSNILLGDADGNVVDMELHGADISEAPFKDGRGLHTNHYVTGERELYGTSPSTFARLARGEEILSAATIEDVAAAKKILLDQDGEFPICQEYHPNIEMDTGTVCCVIMDLRNRVMHLTPGSPLRHGFVQIPLAPST